MDNVTLGRSSGPGGPTGYRYSSVARLGRSLMSMNALFSLVGLLYRCIDMWLKLRKTYLRREQATTLWRHRNVFIIIFAFGSIRPEGYYYYYYYYY